MDESGHDHKNTPLEVRAGVALHAKHIWDFTNAVRHAGKDIFGVSLAEFGIELKGSKLLGHQRFTWANRSPPFRDLERQTACPSIPGQQTKKNRTKER
jgi:hypothetical protein